MSEPPVRLVRLLRLFESSLGEGRLEVINTLRKYMRKGPPEKILDELGHITRLSDLRVLLSAGPSGDVYKTIISKMWMVESGFGVREESV
jgi:hypothetical protein